MDRRFNTQAGIYDVLEQADAVPGVLDVTIGRWLAWPAIKVLIYARLFNALDESPMAMPSAKRVFRGASLGRRLPGTWMRLRSALAQLPSVDSARDGAELVEGPERTSRPRVAWMSGSYARRGPDGIERDALFAELPSELGGHAEQIWLQPPLLPSGSAGVHAENVYELATDWANQLTLLQRFRPAVRGAAAAIAERLTAVTPDAAGLTWQRVCLDAVAMFEARRVAWSVVFGRLHPDLVIMTNAPYLSGEVAAAKSHGAVVAEFQHGLFGPRCPEYGWPGALAAKRARMPVADRLFVFGDLFGAAALKNGFWRAGEVHAIGSAAIERLRRDAVSSRHAEPRLVFLTQPMTRAEAVAFWRRFLAGVAGGTLPRATLTIKIHPSERDQAADYAALAREYPSLCRIAAADEDANRVMLDHDLVVGFTSHGLIEALGLGRAAVSISGEQTPGGVFALCPIPGAGDLIPTIASPAELGALVARATTAAAPAAGGFFAPQPPGSLLQALLDLLETAGRPPRAA
jgi:hypothetical protein